MKSSVVVGLQWGDEGKGKLVDQLAQHYDAVVRFNGGGNAGHTVVVGGEKKVFHVLPSAALWRKQLYIGAGVVVDPESLAQELSQNRVNVVVDYRCTVITPFEKWLDKRLEELRGATAIGTTGRGIGPAYADRMLRVSPRVMDVIYGNGHDLSVMRRLIGDGEDVTDEWLEMSRRVLSPIAGDVPASLFSVYEKGGSILFEGAQGALLDITYGSYPYVTSSNTVASYVGVGAGFPASKIDEVIGVAKLYVTRVGAGPFPTEITDQLSEKIRSKGGEYGSTTGRARRVGWLDLVALKYAISLNEPAKLKLVLTKADVLGGLGDLKAAVAYRVDGKESSNFVDALKGKRAEPVYESFDPVPEAEWGSIAKAGWDAAPRQLRKFIDFIQDYLKVEVAEVSIGAQRGMNVELRRRAFSSGWQVSG
ncbi:adenylosuccinate synthase [Tardisphaera miroshnichenkoae]